MSVETLGYLTSDAVLFLVFVDVKWVCVCFYLFIYIETMPFDLFSLWEGGKQGKNHL